MKLLGVPSRDAASKLRALPRIAVDLGFSGRTKSCGIASQGFVGSAAPQNLTFAACTQRVAELTREAKASVLILEAPLSSAFDAKGNPQARGEFEAKPRPRWWSLGAGAAVALAAQHFLQRLSAAGPEATTVHLVEGFVVGAESVDHLQVASRLLNGFESDTSSRWTQPKGAQLGSVNEWLQGQSDRTAPVILSLGPAV